MTALADGLVGLPAYVVLGLVFLIPALEASSLLGVVLPGEVTVLLGGVVAYEGRLSLAAVVAAAAGGAVIGDNLGFLIGRRYGVSLTARVPRWLLKPRDVARATSMVRRLGGAAVVVGRFISPLRTLVPGLAGMGGMGYRTFAVYNLTGGLLWAAAVAILGYLAGAGYRVVEQRLGLGSEVLLGLVAIAGVVALPRARRRRHAHR
ncbi:MAG TPA: DedA family protein [Mycobacteriales bacterium]|jgi:undecaprenyl-diphosphatase|nr:DedA family protein [Mycobacteriales bacterium]